MLLVVYTSHHKEWCTPTSASLGYPQRNAFLRMECAGVAWLLPRARAMACGCSIKGSWDYLRGKVGGLPWNWTGIQLGIPTIALQLVCPHMQLHIKQTYKQTLTQQTCTCNMQDWAYIYIQAGAYNKIAGVYKHKERYVHRSPPPFIHGGSPYILHSLAHHTLFPNNAPAPENTRHVQCSPNLPHTPNNPTW